MTQSIRTTSTEHRADPRLYAGIGFVVVFLAGFVASNSFQTGAWPMPGVPAAEVQAFFVANPTAMAFNALGQAVAAIALVVFSAGLARTFGGRAAPQLIAAGAVAATTLLLSAALVATAAQPVLADQPGAIAALAHLAFLVGGPSHVVALSILVGTTAIAGRLSGRLPGWLSTFGFVVAGLGLLSVLSLGTPVLPTAVTFLIPAGRFLGFVFIVAAGLTLRRRGRVSA